MNWLLVETAEFDYWVVVAAGMVAEIVEIIAAEILETDTDIFVSLAAYSRCYCSQKSVVL